MRREVRRERKGRRECVGAEAEGVDGETEGKRQTSERRAWFKK